MIREIVVPMLAAIVFLSACATSPPKPVLDGTYGVSILLAQEYLFLQPSNRNSTIRVYIGKDRFDPRYTIRFDSEGRPVEILEGFTVDSYSYTAHSVHRERMARGEVFQIIDYVEGVDGAIHYQTTQTRPYLWSSLEKGVISYETKDTLTIYHFTFLDTEPGIEQGSREVIVDADGRVLSGAIRGFGKPDSTFKLLWNGALLEKVVVSSEGKQQFEIVYARDSSGKAKTITYLNPDDQAAPTPEEVEYQ